MSAAPHPATRTVQSLAVLLDLTRRARAAGSVRELAFLAVNDSSQLAPLRQGATWRLDMGVDALSGVLQPEANAPYVQWLDRLARRLHEETTAETAVRAFDSHALPPDLAEDRQSWWPAQALWVSDPAAPATDKDLQPPAWLFAREEPWTEDELRLIREWRAAWSHAWAALQPARPKGLRSAWQRLRRHLAPRADCPWWRQPRVGWAAAALAVLCLPVRMPERAHVKLYLNASPLSPVVGQVRYVAHEAVARPEGGHAYRVRATLTADTEHRVGLKGSARVQGDWTVLIYWVLRRPLASLRSSLGL